MGFGSRVAALLDAYSNCLDLLKVFKHNSEGPAHENEKERQSLLRQSLRSDRAKIERSYSSKLSERGSRLEKGDGGDLDCSFPNTTANVSAHVAPSRSALARIIKKLKATIHKLLHGSSSQRLDYDSLRALSSASRVDAIQAIDQLSQRIGSSSKSSISISSSKDSSYSKHERRHSPSSTSPRPASGHRAKLSRKARESERSRERQKLSKGTSQMSLPSDVDGRTRSRTGSNVSSTSRNRISMATMSSHSTRLGEVPARKRRLRYTATDSSSEEYNVAPVYPLRTYRSAPVPREPTERRFWSLFKRRPAE